MLKSFAERLRQKNRTMAYPRRDPVLPERFRGLPTIQQGACPGNCSACQDICPTKAISHHIGQDKNPRIQLDLGRCLFCGECETACPAKTIQFTRDYRLGGRVREDLHLGNGVAERIRMLDTKSRSLFGRSLKLRQVSAGGCNACEADTNVLNTLAFDLGRFGIQFAASPRHADGLLITGPVPRNMQLALKKTYDAIPAPKIVIAVGACAISGGIYRDNPEVTNGAETTVPVDLYIPGCPPHPITILDGLLRLIGQVISQ